MAQLDQQPDEVRFPSNDVAPKLTEWKKEPTLLSLKGDLEAAKPSHDAQMNRILEWQDMLMVRGKYKPKQIPGRSQVQPKLVRRQAEWRYSALTEPFLGSNKLFKVSPVTFEDADAARQNELVLNWQFRTKLNRVKFIDDFVRANVDEGTCIMRLGWIRVTKMQKVPKPTWTHYALQSPEDLQNFQQAVQFKVDDPRHFEENMDPAVQAAVALFEQTQQPNRAEQSGITMVDEEKIICNHPTVEVMNPQNVYIDPACLGNLDKAQFVCVTFETCKADLLKEPKKYVKAQLDKVLWESNSPLATPDHATTTPNDYQLQDQLRRKVVAYEYWGFWDIDGTGELKPVVVTWIGNVIIRMQENPYPDQKLPFVISNYLPVKRDLYGEPDAELLGDQQAILGAVTRGMIDLMAKSANAQQGMAKGMLDPLNKRKFEQGQDYEYNPNANPQLNLIQHKFPDIPNSAMQMIALQNNEAESLTGVKAFAGGVSGDTYGDVAAGIRGALDAASKREMAILRRLAKAMSELGSKICAMNEDFLSDKEVVRVTNEQFVTVNRDDLKGEYDLEVDISTAEVDNQKSQDLAFMLQTMGPNMAPQFSMMILAEIATLKRMPELAHKIKTFKPEPDPMQEQLKQLEVENAQLENEKLKSEIAYNNARASEVGTKADLNNLDYIEQETGTKHARTMQEHQSQAQGNQDLAVTKALLTPSKEGEKAPNIAAALGYNNLSQANNQAGQPGL